MKNKKSFLYDERFLESFAGTAILKDIKVAIIELIANSWDAGATQVDIIYPQNDYDVFSIKDNGHGMTESDFLVRFRTLAYNRTSQQGNYAEIPKENKSLISKRPAFGKNGKGRFASFAFGDSFTVKTWRDKKLNVFKVFKEKDNSVGFQYDDKDKQTKDGHGTEIHVENVQKPLISEHDIRTEIGMRFLADPNFTVTVNTIRVTFSDIPEENLKVIEFNVDDIGKIKITVIDVQSSDRTTQQHGIAWHVKRRLVGECTWKGSSHEYFIDGRKAAAKRYQFIVEADCIENAVFPDWTAFNPKDPKFERVNPIVQKKIKDYIFELSHEERQSTFNEIKEENQRTLNNISYLSRDKWEKFVKTVQKECPTIADNDLQKVSEVLANLEQSQSQYSLINQLSVLTPDQLDKLDEILKKWNIDMATIVLDELEFRLKLLEQLNMKFLKSDTDEVQELQPLFHRGLWIFGPEYETIEYTSNQGMTNVIQNLFKVDMKGSLRRPDFAILPNGTVGLYSYPKYDDEGAELGVDRLTIVELKKPTVSIGREEKGQAWGYVKELMKNGLIRQDTNVTCFIVGSKLDMLEAGTTKENNDKVVIVPIDFDTIINRAKSRLHKLYDKVKHSPFLEQERMKEYMKERSQQDLFTPLSV